MIAEMLVDIINMIAFITYIIIHICWHKLELISAKLGVEMGFYLQTVNILWNEESSHLICF